MLYDIFHACKLCEKFACSSIIIHGYIATTTTTIIIIIIIILIIMNWVFHEF